MWVADWYRTEAQNPIIDIQDKIDILELLYQGGLNVLDDLRYIVDPTMPRWSAEIRLTMLAGLIRR